jgi:5-methylthioadenosine/S-adenosylhomocysteine deaminase
MPASTIIANAFVLTCDPLNRAGRLSLLLRDGRIQEIAHNADTFLAGHPDATVIDASQKLIIPGLVNAHVHGESMLLRERTRGRHAGLWKRDARLLEAANRLADPKGMDDLRMLYLYTCFSHLKAGTTCIGEFPPPVNDKGLVQILQAIDRSDLRSVVALQNWDQIQQARDLGAGRPHMVISLGREEDYTVYSFEHLLRTAGELGIPALAHAAEQREETEAVRKNFQKSLMAVLRDFGALRQNTILVHLNHMADTDLGFIEEAGAHVVLTPRSSMMKQTGYPALRTLLAGRRRPGLGTDWGSVDMVAEMQFLHQLPLMFPGIPRISPADILKMGTINGAAALGLAAETGSIEPGKQADLTFFGLHTLRAPLPRDSAGAQDLAEFVLDALSSRDVSDVMIGGEFYVRKGQMLTMAEEDVSAGFRALRDRWFPVAAPPPSPEEVQRVKILPPVPEALRDAGQGFEQGLPAVEPQPLPPPASSPMPPPPPPQREIRSAALPELSKDVRRVFGDEEES